ncbi:MAG: glycosyltransferase family 4 protein [Bacteroidaceae bacterium]|nr:glycosyltransferase family 4 protein [Bacteroidaceae bacterium]
MRILFIELCNFHDYPTGGHLSFALHMLGAFGNELKLVGINTAGESEVGKWYKKEIDGVEYDYFSVANVEKRSKKPLIPGRITAYFRLKKYIKKVFETEYDKILIQTPEVLFAIPKKHLHKTCLIMPGVGNPLSISRFRFAKIFAGIYDWFFFRKAQYASVILAAADKNAMASFVARSKGKINADKARQFPTRYDATIFKVKDRARLRQEYGIDANTILYVTVGRLNWFKGWKFMIDCIEKLNNPLAKLVFIGDGEDEQKIKDYIAERKLEKQIELIGRKPLDVISDYENMANAFIMGSYTEGWSTALVEAVACGTPCVVTEFSSASDMIEDGVNGWVIKDRNEEDFTKRLKDVLLLDRCGVEKKAKDISNLSVQNMHKQFLSDAGWDE